MDAGLGRVRRKRQAPENNDDWTLVLLTGYSTKEAWTRYIANGSFHRTERVERDVREMNAGMLLVGNVQAHLWSLG